MNQSRVGYTGLCTRLRLGESSKVVLGEVGYLKERLTPQPGDVLFLHLSDLLIALKALIPTHVSMVLDYGCGGSPYRPLFGSCTYHRADLSGGNNLDFEYGADSKLPSEVSGYDCVLSTQVLEHVEDPETYLRECYRALRPGGRLVLTTHGLFEDHACPYDYWRWTAYELKRLVENSGLKIEAVKKLTTGGMQTRSFCYVDDLVEGLIRLMETGDGVVGPVNLGNPDEFTNRQLAEIGIDITGSASKIVHRPLPTDDPKQRQPDISEAQELLGWTVPLRVGLTKTAAYFEELLAREAAIAVAV